MQSLRGWRCIEYGDTIYIIKKTCDNEIFRVIVSDMIHIWVKESSEDEILNIFQDLNPLIECNNNNIVHKIWSIVEDFIDKKQDTSSSHLEITVVEDNILQLKFQTVMDGHTFKLYLNLIQESPHVLFKEVTAPLMSTAEELLLRQDHLCSLLEKKDIEIAQYKIEGASLQRLSVETQPFVKMDFLAQPLFEDVTKPSQAMLKVLSNVNLKSGLDPDLKNFKENSETLQPERNPPTHELPPSHICQAMEQNQTEKDCKTETMTQEKENPNFPESNMPKRENNASKLLRKKKPKLNL